MPAFNYYNNLAWTYKFYHKLNFDEAVLVNNSDLSLRIRLRRCAVPYVPFFSSSDLSFILKSSRFVNFYLQLDNRFASKSETNILKDKIVYLNSSLLTNSNFKRFFNGLDVLLSYEKFENSRQLLFIGSYDPINNNFYDSKFLDFWHPKILNCTHLKALQFFRIFFVFVPFEIFFNFFISSISIISCNKNE